MLQQAGYVSMNIIHAHTTCTYAFTHHMQRMHRTHHTLPQIIPSDIDFTCLLTIIKTNVNVTDLLLLSVTLTDGQTDGQTDRLTDREMDRQTDGQTDKEMER